MLLLSKFRLISIPCSFLSKFRLQFSRRPRYITFKDDRYNNPDEDENRLPPEILGRIMHQLKLEESVDEIWVAVQTTYPILVINIRLRLPLHVNVAVFLGLATTPSKEQLKKFADDGMFAVLPLSPSTPSHLCQFFVLSPTASASLQRVQALPLIAWGVVQGRMKRGYPLEARDCGEGMRSQSHLSSNCLCSFPCLIFMNHHHHQILPAAATTAQASSKRKQRSRPKTKLARH